MVEALHQSQILTFRFRMLPTTGQHKRLSEALDHTRDLYNAALEERVSAYRRCKKTVNLNEQQAGLTELRRDPDYAGFPVSLQRWPLKRLDLAFRRFFSGLKPGAAKAGYPRFKGRDRLRSFGFTDRWGWQVAKGRICIKGIGAIRARFHRGLPSQPIALKIKRDGKQWYALLSVSVPVVAPVAADAVGLDLGVSQLATLSTGEQIANARHANRLAARIKRARRAISRCQRRSKNREKARERLASAKRKETNSRNTHLHQTSASLSRRFKFIVVERLKIGNMVRSCKGTMADPGRNVAQKRGLSRSVHDAAFGRLLSFLDYKAAITGGRIIDVNPQYSSQTCAECGSVDAKSRRSQSLFICTACGHRGDADVNAARVIAFRGGVAVPGGHNLEIAQDGRRKLGASTASEMLPSTPTGSSGQERKKRMARIEGVGHDP